METLIISLIAGFINKISDKSKAKQIGEAILAALNAILTGQPVSGLTGWASFVIGLVEEALIFVESKEAFLQPIIAKVTEIVGQLESDLTAQATDPKNAPSLAAIKEAIITHVAAVNELVQPMIQTNNTIALKNSANELKKVADAIVIS